MERHALELSVPRNVDGFGSLVSDTPLISNALAPKYLYKNDCMANVLVCARKRALCCKGAGT